MNNVSTEGNISRLCLKVWNNVLIATGKSTYDTVFDPDLSSYLRGKRLIEKISDELSEI